MLWDKLWLLKNEFTTNRYHRMSNKYSDVAYIKVENLLEICIWQLRIGHRGNVILKLKENKRLNILEIIKLHFN